jgi:nucleoid-associated protein YgaU
VVDRTYTVVAGDALRALAARFYGDPNRIDEISAANTIADPDALVAGTVLTIPDLDLTPAPVFNDHLHQT